MAVFLAWVAAWSWSPSVHACKCADTSTTVERPRLTSDASAVRVRNEHIEIRCEDRALTRCTWKQSHHLRNDGDRSAHVEGRIGDTLHDVKVRVELTGDASPRADSVDANAIAFDLPARRQATVVIEARVSFGSGSCSCWASGLMRRHPVVSRGSDVQTALTYVTHTGLPEDPWTSVSLGIEYPGPARIRSTHADQSRKFATQRIDGGRLRSTATFADEEIAIFLERRNPIARGGPFAAIGGGWGTTRPLRLRAGYELGAPRWLVHSIAIETDTSDVRVVPAIQALSGHAWFPLLPAAGIGLGVPIDIYPRPRVGMRAQIDLSWYVVTFVAAADYFPAQGPGPWTGSLFAQFSF
jgi:hypothetical protein